jgi:hypothetical protein
MGKLVVFTNLTLDGVMQAPGRPDEDLRGGFTHGGGTLATLRLVAAKPTDTGVVVASYQPAESTGQRTATG